ANGDAVCRAMSPCDQRHEAGVLSIQVIRSTRNASAQHAIRSRRDRGVRVRLALEGRVVPGRPGVTLQPTRDVVDGELGNRHLHETDGRRAEGGRRLVWAGDRVPRDVCPRDYRVAALELNLLLLDG